MPFYSAVVIVFFASVPILKGAVFFPSNSAYGIFAAIAVPLDLGPHRNVFVSYNFEANYNLPVNWQLPTYLDIANKRGLKDSPHIDQSQSVSADNATELSMDIENTATNATSTQEEDEEGKDVKSRERRSLLSRRIFYNMLKQKFKMHGFSGEGCLLRIICETNASRIGEGNGFLGSVIHIIFSPSSSKEEGMSEIYYKAEFDGQNSKCTPYQETCPENILDFISTPVHEIMDSISRK